MKALEILVRLFFLLMVLIMVGTMLVVCPWLIIILVTINYMIKYDNNKKKDNEFKQIIIDHIKKEEESKNE